MRPETLGPVTLLTLAGTLVSHLGSVHFSGYISNCEYLMDIKKHIPDAILSLNSEKSNDVVSVSFLFIGISALKKTHSSISSY
jgi:hypothetical protein